MGNTKMKPKQNSEGVDSVISEIRKARLELAVEIEKDADAVHQRALQHMKEYGFRSANLKPKKLIPKD
jgi:hypothetical protein